MRAQRSMRKLDYSPKESRLLALLPENGNRITSTVLVDKLYPSGDAPFHARSCVVSTMRILMRKIAINKEPYRVQQSPQAGPVPLQYWIEHPTPTEIAAWEIDALVDRGVLERVDDDTYRATVVAS
jgi:hypothetical protein